MIFTKELPSPAFWISCSCDLAAREERVLRAKGRERHCELRNSTEKYFSVFPIGPLQSFDNKFESASVESAIYRDSWKERCVRRVLVNLPPTQRLNLVYINVLSNSLDFIRALREYFRNRSMAWQVHDILISFGRVSRVHRVFIAEESRTQPLCATEASKTRAMKNTQRLCTTFILEAYAYAISAVCIYARSLFYDETMWAMFARCEILGVSHGTHGPARLFNATCVGLYAIARCAWLRRRSYRACGFFSRVSSLPPPKRASLCLDNIYFSCFLFKE